MSLQTHCSNCRSPLVPVHISDLVGKSLRTSEAAKALTEFVLNHFTLIICSNCGLTQWYGDSRVKKIAEDLWVDQGGHG
jgi:predicted nucleic-acid-binding Zn-ribbon protein